MIRDMAYSSAFQTFQLQGILCALILPQGHGMLQRTQGQFYGLFSVHLEKCLDSPLAIVNCTCDLENPANILLCPQIAKYLQWWASWCSSAVLLTQILWNLAIPPQHDFKTTGVTHLTGCDGWHAIILINRQYMTADMYFFKHLLAFGR